MKIVVIYGGKSAEHDIFNFKQPVQLLKKFISSITMCNQCTLQKKEHG